MFELDNTINGIQFVLAPIIYTIYLMMVLIFFSFRFMKTQKPLHYSIIISAFVFQALSIASSHILQIYSRADCLTYFLSRFVYVLNFFMVSFTIYYWAKDFSTRESKVLNMNLFFYFTTFMNLTFLIMVLTAFFVFVAQGDECQAYDQAIEQWNTWTCVGSNMVLAIFCFVFGIIIVYRYQHQVSHFSSSDSKKSFGLFLVCTTFLVVENLLRFLMHLYFPITHKYMNDSLYQFLIHWLPDLIEYVVLLIIWSLDSMSTQFNKDFEMKMFLYSKTILSNIKLETFDGSTDASESYQNDKSPRPNYQQF
ncbi:Serpentine receptor class gamma [Entamoeba marina]